MRDLTLHSLELQYAQTLIIRMLPPCRSRGVVQIQAKLTFEPEKVNIFNKDCQRGGKEVTCMSVIVCLSLDFRTKTRTKTRKDVGRSTQTCLLIHLRGI